MTKTATARDTALKDAELELRRLRKEHQEMLYQVVASRDRLTNEKDATGHVLRNIHAQIAVTTEVADQCERRVRNAEVDLARLNGKTA